MIDLLHNDILSLIKGASVYTTGGGVAYHQQITMRDRLHAKLFGPDDFAKNSFVATILEIGSAASASIDCRKAFLQMYNTWTKAINIPVAGLYASELGQEALLFKAAHVMNLPVADMDVAGCRAVPLCDITSFAAANIHCAYSPCVIYTGNEHIEVIQYPLSDIEAEEYFRIKAAQSSEGVIMVMGGLIQVDTLLRKKLFNFSLSQSLHIGKISSYDNLVKELKPYAELEGYVTHHEERGAGGFNAHIAYFKSSHSSEEFRIFILNEAVHIETASGSIVSSVPDRIFLVSKEECIGISSEELLSGRKVSILCAHPESLWQTERAYKLFSFERLHRYFF